MKNPMFKIAILSLLLLAVPMSGKADTSWTLYTPGLVKSFIEKGETVLLGYLSSW